MKKFNLKESSEETIKQAVRNFYSKKSKEDLLNEIFTILDMFLKDKGLSYDDLARGLKAQGITGLADFDKTETNRLGFEAISKGMREEIELTNCIEK